MMRFFLLLAAYLPVIAASLASGASGSSTIKNVVVVGGTHGNEYTGVWCIKALDRTAAQVAKTYPSLHISTLLANPQAHLENKRFVDDDLNRQFSHEKLSDVVISNSETGQLVPRVPTVESLRAQEINQLLGPKGSGDACQTDVIVDLHSTTSNMGLTIIIPEGDALMAAAAAYVMLKCDGDVKCLMHSHPSKDSRPNLSSTAKHGFTIEVGPVPQGLLRQDAVQKTDQAIHALLDFLHQRNTPASFQQNEELLRNAYPQNRVPCFRSAPAQRPGEMSGKIPWPCDEDNINFPAVLIHPTVQDADFGLVHEGDPLFIDLEGHDIPYSGSHGSPVHLLFVNEGGYYYASSGTGIGVAIDAEFDFQTGLLIQESAAVPVHAAHHHADAALQEQMK